MRASQFEAALALAASLSVLAGCQCGGVPPATSDVGRPDVGAVDSPRLDGGPIIERCGDGIRRIAVDLEPLPTPGSSLFVTGRPDRVVVLQSHGPDDALVGRLTIADPEGVPVAIHEVALPLAGPLSPCAFRGDGPYEVLYVRQDAPQFAIVRFDDGPGEAVVPSTDLVLGVTAAVPAARGGFVAFGTTGGGGVGLGAIDSEGVAIQPLEIRPSGSGGICESFGLALSDPNSAGIVYGGFRSRDDAFVSALRIDTNSFPFAVDVVELGALATTHGVSASIVPGGVVLGFAVEAPFFGVRFYWLDDALTVQAVGEVETGLVSWPSGVTGAGPEAVVFTVNGLGGTTELRAGIADVPGVIGGGGRALVAGLEGSAVEGVWQTAGGGAAVAYWRGTVEVVTLCEPP